MATEKKLIYITSDEQLVHEISLKRSKNTYIIDLDTGEPINATVSKHVCNIYLYQTENIISFSVSLTIEFNK